MLENQLVRELSGHVSQRRALQLVGLAASSWHYRRRPRPRAVEPVSQARRAYPSRLSDDEVARIRKHLAAGFAAGKSVYSSWFDALDAADPVASLKTWYRIAKRDLENQRPRRRQRTRRATAMPQFEATGPNQVWCWDITKLAGPYIGVHYDLYAIIDAFSRCVISWRVEETERDDLARDMFITAINHHGTPAMVHSDGGAAMKSAALARLFREHHITPSRNRPRVSNDNPFIESWFKTAKYRPDYPQWFTSLDTARAWAAAAIDTYNHQHHHSSLEGHTPASVHHGTWNLTHLRRQATLDTLAQAHPHRWKQHPRLRTPYAAVRLNMENSQQRLQTA